MAEGTYEYECMRAELLGIGKPNQEEFEKARAERLQQEQAEIEAAEANVNNFLLFTNIFYLHMYVPTHHIFIKLTFILARRHTG